MTIDVLKTLPNESRRINGSVPIRQSVRRSLFGKVNHDESLEFLNKQLNAIAESEKKRWNFDFTNEVPLEPSNYEWTPVKPTDSVPTAYALSRLPYLYEHTENTTSTSPESQSQPELPEVTIFSKLKQTSLDGYIKKKKRPSTLEPKLSNKKICLTPKKTQT